MSEDPDILHEVRLLHGLRVPMRDGVRLSADVYLPRYAQGPFPTIVTRTPYESGRDVFIALGVWWAERGYAFAVVTGYARRTALVDNHGFGSDFLSRRQ